ncbi:hypothetical protein OAH36_03540, partial [Verrucomicrobia bacterium]|nr:hypothetical protein [Verrucomicrobiota bacterium]
AQTISLSQKCDVVPPRRYTPDVDFDLETICLKCLQENADSRYRSADDLADDLGFYLHGDPIKARPPTWQELIIRAVKKYPVVAGLMSALIVSVILGIGGFVSQWKDVVREQNVSGETIYGGDIFIAQKNLEAGNYGEARRLLSRYAPGQPEHHRAGWEWRFLWRESFGDSLHAFDLGSTIGTCVAYSPCGRYFAAGTWNSEVVVWSTSTLEEIKRTTVPGFHAYTLRFSPDGSRLYAGFGKGVQHGAEVTGRAYVWSVTNAGVLNSFDIPSGHMDFSPDGGLLAVSKVSLMYSGSEPSDVEVFETSNGRSASVVRDAGWRVAFASDGNSLLAGRSDGRFRIYDLPSYNLRQELVSESPIFSIAQSFDGLQIAAGGLSGRVTIWSQEGGVMRKRDLSRRSSFVWDLDFSLDGELLAVADLGTTLRVVDLTNDSDQALMGHGNEVWATAFAADSRLLVSGGKDGSVRVWDPEASGSRVQQVKVFNSPPVFSSDGKKMLAVNRDRELVSYDISSRVETVVESGSIPLAMSKHWLAFYSAKNGSIRFRSSKDQSLSGEISPSEYLTGGFWTVLDPFLLGRAERVAGEGSCFWSTLASIDSDDRYAAIPGEGGEVAVFEMLTQTPTRVIETGFSKATCVKFSPDGTQIAVTGRPESHIELHQWKSLSIAPRKLSGHFMEVRSVCYFADGKRLVYGSMDGRAILWDTESGLQLHEFVGHRAGINWLSISADAQTLATAAEDMTTKLWHLSLRRELASFSLQGTVRFVEFVNGGETLAIYVDSPAEFLRNEATVLLFSGPYSDPKE